MEHRNEDIGNPAARVLLIAVIMAAVLFAWAWLTMGCVSPTAPTPVGYFTSDPEHSSENDGRAVFVECLDDLGSYGITIDPVQVDDFALRCDGGRTRDQLWWIGEDWVPVIAKGSAVECPPPTTSPPPPCDYRDFAQALKWEPVTDEVVDGPHRTPDVEKMWKVVVRMERR